MKVDTLYLKDENMPKSCATCKYFSDWKGGCIFKFSFFPVPKFAFKTRQKFCPLKPLSEASSDIY